MELDIIYNPFAGGEKKMKKNLALVEDKLNALKIVYRLHRSEYAKHAIALTKEAIANGAKTVVAMGGDGTLNEVLNGLYNFENITFGLLPCGTGNDFAAHCRLPEKVDEALDVILTKPATYIDFIQMPELRAVNVVGTGLDVKVLQLYSALQKKTKIGYFNSLIRALFTYKCSHFTAVVDGVKKEYKSFISALANASMFGGGLKIAPGADIADGKLNFVYVEEIRGLKLIPALLKLKKGKVNEIKQAHIELCEKIEIKSENCPVINLDGELYENRPFSAEIVHNVLKMHR